MKISEALFGAQCQRFSEFGVGCARLVPKKMNESDRGKPSCEEERLRRIAHQGETFVCQDERLVGMTEDPLCHREPAQRRRLSILTVEDAVRVSRFAAVETDAGLEIGCIPLTKSPRTQRTMPIR